MGRCSKFFCNKIYKIVKLLKINDMRIIEIEDDSVKLVCDVENIIMVGWNEQK